MWSCRPASSRIRPLSTPGASLQRRRDNSRDLRDDGYEDSTRHRPGRRLCRRPAPVSLSGNPQVRALVQGITAAAVGAVAGAVVNLGPSITGRLSITVASALVS